LATTRHLSLLTKSMTLKHGFQGQ